MFGADGGSGRDFVLGCLLAASALRWCRVLENRWVLPHHSVRASFGMNRWSADVKLYGFLSSGLLPGFFL